MEYIKYYKCSACSYGDIIDAKGNRLGRCDWCHGAGWIFSDYDVPYYPISLPMMGIDEEET